MENKEKNRILFVIILLILPILLVMNVKAKENTKTFEYKKYGNDFVIADSENQNNLYICTQYNAVWPAEMPISDNKCYKLDEELVNKYKDTKYDYLKYDNVGCLAGAAEIISSQQANIINKNNFNHKIVTEFNGKKIDSGIQHNNYSITSFLLNTYFRRICEGYTNKKVWSVNGGRIDYYDAFKLNKEDSNLIYNKAKVVRKKVNEIKNSINFTEDIIKFDDSYESKIDVNVIKDMYLGDSNYSIECIVQNATFNGGNGKLSEGNTKIKISNPSKKETLSIVTTDVSSKIKVTCNANYSHNVTNYYFCRNYQDVVSYDLEKKNIEGNKISITNTTDSQPTNDNSCKSRLNDIKKKTDSEERRNELIALFDDYPNNTNLLNFLNPECSKADCGDTSISCLNYSYNVDDLEDFSNDPKNFNENNFSCFDEIIDKDSKKMFCSKSLKLIANESYYQNNSTSLILNANEPHQQKFPAIYAGQLYFNVENGILLNGDFKQTCYLSPGVSSIGNFSIVNPIENIEVKLGENVLKKSENISDILNGSVGSNGKEIIFKQSLEFKIPAVYSNLSGEKVSKDECYSKGNCTLIGYGLLSPLSSNGSNKYDFEVNLNINKINEDMNNVKNATCEFQTVPQIIKDNKLQIEFREIDVDHPFIKNDGTERNTMTNWCENNEDLVSCSSNNNIVQTYIKESTNSYNSKYTSNGTKTTGDGPKYKITLTPQLMDDIKKEYGQKLKYDEFNLECRDKISLNECKDSTLDENKVYQTSQLLTYLKDTKKVLTINKSTKRK